MRRSDVLTPALLVDVDIFDCAVAPGARSSLL
jgi:hypothetical protein